MYMSGLSRLAADPPRDIAESYVGISPDTSGSSYEIPGRGPSVPVGPYGPYPYPTTPRPPSGNPNWTIPNIPQPTPKPNPVSPQILEQRRKVELERMKEINRRANVQKLQKAKFNNSHKDNFTKWVKDNGIWIGDTSAMTEARQKFSQLQNQYISQGSQFIPSTAAKLAPPPSIPVSPFVPMTPPPGPTIDLEPPPGAYVPELSPPISDEDKEPNSVAPIESEGWDFEKAWKEAKDKLEEDAKVFNERKKQIISEAEKRGQMLPSGTIERRVQEYAMLEAQLEANRKSPHPSVSEPLSISAALTVGNEFKKGYDEGGLSKAAERAQAIEKMDIKSLTEAAHKSGALPSIVSGAIDALSIFSSNKTIPPKSTKPIEIKSKDTSVSEGIKDALSIFSNNKSSEDYNLISSTELLPHPKGIENSNGDENSPPKILSVGGENRAPRIISVGGEKSEPVSETVANVVSGANQGADLAPNTKFIMSKDVFDASTIKSNKAASAHEEQNLSSLESRLNTINKQINKIRWQAGSDLEIDNQLTNLYKEQRGVESRIKQAKTFLQR